MDIFSPHSKECSFHRMIGLSDPLFQNPNGVKTLCAATDPSANELPTAFGRAAKRARPYLQREDVTEAAVPSEEQRRDDSQAGPGSEAPGPSREAGTGGGQGDDGAAGQDPDVGANPLEGMSERQKKLFELKQKMVRKCRCTKCEVPRFLLRDESAVLSGCDGNRP